MLRTGWFVVVPTVLLALIASPTAIQPAAADVGLETAGPIRIDLSHPTPVASVVKSFSRSGLRITELRVTGDVTGFFRVGDMNQDEIVQKYTKQISSRFAGQVGKVVTSVVAVPVDANAPSIRKNLGLDDLDVAGVTASVDTSGYLSEGVRLTPEQRKMMLIEREGGSVQERQELDSNLPGDRISTASIKTGWQFPYGQTQVSPEDTGVWISNAVNSEYSGYIFDYDQWSDYGYELDFKELHPTLQGTRPDCAFGNDQFFYAARGNGSPLSGEIQSFFTNVMTDARPYFDGNDALDPCRSLDLSIGIGKPGILPNGLYASNLYFDIHTWRGNVSQSQITLGQQKVSNDCNDIGQPENSNCMGLNDQRAGTGTYYNIGTSDNVKVPCVPGGGWSGYAFMAQKYFQDTNQPDHYTSC